METKERILHKNQLLPCGNQNAMLSRISAQMTLILEVSLDIRDIMIEHNEADMFYRWLETKS